MIVIEFNGLHWVAHLEASRMTHEHLPSLIANLIHDGYNAKNMNIMF